MYYAPIYKIPLKTISWYFTEQQNINRLKLSKLFYNRIKTIFIWTISSTSISINIVFDDPEIFSVSGVKWIRIKDIKGNTERSIKKPSYIQSMQGNTKRTIIPKKMNQILQIMNSTVSNWELSFLVHHPFITALKMG